MFRLAHAISGGLVLALVLACGSEGGGGPADPVLTTVGVTPVDAEIYVTAPGNVVDLVVVALDQDGELIDAEPPTFLSSNPAVATVNAQGRVTALAAGTAQITATVQAGGVSRSGTASVTVLIPPFFAEVSAPHVSFDPPIVHIAAGGSVAYTMSIVQHTVIFSGPNAPPNIPQVANTTISRDFPVAGTYDFACDIHAGMVGKVHVH